MNIALWIIAGLLAVGFAGAGVMKLTKSPAELAESGMGWAADVSPAAVKAIGAAELLGAIGLVLPAAVNVLPVLVPIAATGLVIVMGGAVVTHVRRKEIPGAVPALVLLGLSAFVAVARFGPYAF
ncbi:DoxX family protein [Williamsia sp. CHRR-6]|uniref:DoxX family protein n=1 Tax=Williamsia sp. CHRR-6 TaxID=2835871 RepID=UPI001BD93797|nr:DoxX family protein [Williamsia sp. CHRR-6]MBT0567852.1 DoxX family protein [Williamsia sp. CHRR-6]